MEILLFTACLAAGAALLCACSKPAVSSGAAEAAEPGTAAAIATTSRKPCDLLSQADAENASGAPLPQNSTDLHSAMRLHLRRLQRGELTVNDWDSIMKAEELGDQRRQRPAPIRTESATRRSNSAGTVFRRWSASRPPGGRVSRLVLNGAKIDHLRGADALAAEQALAQKIVARF